MSLVSQARERLRALFSRSREEQDLAQELRFHIEMETEANVRRGMGREEARRQALIALGGVERTKEDVRGAWSLGLLEDLLQDLRYALRRLVREPGFSLPVTATLGLGIGVAAAVFGLANAVLIRPLPYPDADRIVSLRHAASRLALPMTGISPGLADYYRTNSRVFEDVGVFVEHVSTLTDLDWVERVYWAFATPGFFSVLRPGVSAGRLLRETDYEPPAADRGGVVRGVVISHALWTQRYGADPALVGGTIEMMGGKRLVLGVAEPGFHFPHPETHVWFAFGWPVGQASRASLRNLAYGGIARLKPGVSLEEAQRDLDRLVRALPERFPDVTTEQLEEMGFRATPIPLKQEVIGGVREAVVLLLAAAAFLLMITWANATNLTLVRAVRMRRETAVARALGAGDIHLVRRFLSESAVLAAVGGALGLGLAALAIKFRFGFAPDDIPRLRGLSLDGAILGLAVGLCVASAVLLGAMAWASARRTHVASTLTGVLSRVTAGRREQTVQRFLVAGQVALALTLLVGSALMAQSFWRLKQVSLGFEPEGALAFRLDLASARHGPNYYHNIVPVHAEILARLRALPGAEAVDVGSTSAFPLTPVPSYYNFRIGPPEGSPLEPSGGWPSGLLSFATPGYFRTMGIPLVRGRTFRPEDTGREGHGIILSASLARALFGDRDAVGRGVTFEGTVFTVVGIAGDVPSEAIRKGPSNAFYFPNIHPPKADTITGVVHWYIPDDEFYVVRTRRPTASIVPAIQRVVRDVDPKLTITQVGTLEELIAGDMARSRVTMLLLMVASVTALALAVIGIYGVLAYAVSQRTNELGVRIALGQSPEAAVRMVVGQGAGLAVAGVAAGLFAAFALTRYLRTVLYQVSPSDPASFVGMAALLLMVSVLASYLTARRAGRIDPVQALKRE